MHLKQQQLLCSLLYASLRLRQAEFHAFYHTITINHTHFVLEVDDQLTALDRGGWRRPTCNSSTFALPFRVGSALRSTNHLAVTQLRRGQ